MELFYYNRFFCYFSVYSLLFFLPPLEVLNPRLLCVSIVMIESLYSIDYADSRVNIILNVTFSYFISLHIGVNDLHGVFFNLANDFGNCLDAGWVQG